MHVFIFVKCELVSLFLNFLSHLLLTADSLLYSHTQSSMSVFPSSLLSITNKSMQTDSAEEKSFKYKLLPLLQIISAQFNTRPHGPSVRRKFATIQQLKVIHDQNLNPRRHLAEGWNLRFFWEEESRL